MAHKDSILVSRTLYQMGMVILIGSLVWAGMGVYSSLNKQAILPVDASTLEPIDTTLDQTVVEAMAKRIKIEGELLVTPTAKPVEINLITELATTSATIEAVGETP